MLKENEPPVSLMEIQEWFASMITRPFRGTGELHLPIYDEQMIQDIEQRIPRTATLRSEQRIGIYNQQYWWRLYVLLQEYYPTLLRIFGYRDFNLKIAEPFLLRHPPADWFLPNIALPLPKWLRETYTDSDRQLVLQIAEVDEAYERLYHVPTRPSIASVTLALNSPIYLQPFVETFTLDANFFAFRSSFLEQEPVYWEQNDFPELETAKGIYYFVLYRLPSGLEYKELCEAQYLLLNAFKRGSTIEEACATLEQSPDMAESAKNSIAGWFKEWSDLNFLSQEK